MQFNEDDSRGETECAFNNEPIASPNENHLLIAGQAEVSIYPLPKTNNSSLQKATEDRKYTWTHERMA